MRTPGADDGQAQRRALFHPSGLARVPAGLSLSSCVGYRYVAVRMPCKPRTTPGAIVAVRKQTGVSQAAMAAFLNVAVSTISQWERGERHPTGAALKLLPVVRQNGIEALG